MYVLFYYDMPFSLGFQTTITDKKGNKYISKFFFFMLIFLLYLLYLQKRILLWLFRNDEHHWSSHTSL